MVPQARLTGGSIVVRLLEFLYTITGQRHVPGLSEANDQGYGPFRGFCEEVGAVGFEYDVEEVTLENSEVTLFVAVKQRQAG